MFKQFKAVKALALVAATVGGSLSAAPGAGSAAATNTGSNPAGAYSTTTGYYAYDSVATTPSSVVTAPTIMAIKTQKIMGLVSAVAAEATAAMTGSEAAPSADGGVKLAGSSGSQHRASAWARASHGAIDNAEKGQEWNGNSYLLMLGADYRANKMFCLGLGLSYSRLDARTEFNKGTQIEDTFGVNPYLIIVPHKNFNLEIVGGASWTKGQDTRRWITTKPNAVAGPSTEVDNEYKASPKSQAVFGGVFANFINTAGKASYGLQVGYLMMQTKFKAFKETSASSTYSFNAKDVPANTFEAGTVTGKVKAAYQLTPSVAPFLTLHTLYDAKQNKGVEYTVGNKSEYKVARTAFGGGGGLGFKGDDALSGGLEFDFTKRGKLSTYVTGLRLHYGF